MAESAAGGESTPISKRNLIDKIGFIAGHTESLEQQFQEYLASLGEQLVTRQAISLWIQKKSTPSRSAAFTFLKGFLKEFIIYAELSEDQKRVLARVSHFLDQSLNGIQERRPGPKPFHGIQVAKNGAVLLAGLAQQAAYDQLIRTWGGTYLVYRMSLLEPTIVQEVVRLRKIRNSLQYQHWYMRDGTNLEHFEGGAILLGDAVWMAGTSQDSTRYRFCHFRNNPSLNPQSRRFRWGLMHTDIPNHTAHEPVSTRVLLVRVGSEIPVFETFVRAKVRHIEFEDLPEHLRDVVNRAVRNELSALSTAGGITPLQRPDTVLRVDHLTLEHFARFHDTDPGTSD